MQLKKTGQTYRTIYVTDSYQRLVNNIDNYDDLTGLLMPFAVETFATAITKAGTKDTTIAIEKAVPITADTSVPANVTIDIRKGGSFAVSTGITLTILGTIITNGQAMGTIFSGLGAVAADVTGVFNELITGYGFVPGGSAQDIFTESATANFKLGTRIVEGDRVFRYCKAGAALTRFIGGFNNNTWPINAALTAEATALATTISVPDAACAVNAYAGGYIVLFSSPLQFYRILSNTVSDGVDTVLTIETPLKVTCAIGIWATGYASPYADLRNITTGAVGFGSVMAVPIINVQSGYYFWGQTWGPCYAVADGTVPGTVVSERHVFFAQSGNIEPFVDAGSGNGQLAGYIIPVTSGGGGDQFYMLTLQP